MSDLWDSLGANITQGPDDGAWLYRRGTDTHGPMGRSAIVEKWLTGEIDSSTPVARQGTAFVPLGQVAAFAAFSDAAQTASKKRQRRKNLSRLTLIVVLFLGVGAGAAYLMHEEYAQRIRQQYDEQVRAEQRAQAQSLAQAQVQAEAERQANLAHAAAHAMKLVALVSLGSLQDVKITQTLKKHGRSHTSAGGRGGKASNYEFARPGEQRSGPPDDSLVETCQLSQQDIFSTLKAELAKLNVCVEDEKRRDDAGLLPKSLELQFVVRADGKVTEFVVNDRHFRTGALNNCLVKAFRTIHFKQTQGANCPVTIPIKIGV